jgi:hypothetical protein
MVKDVTHLGDNVFLMTSVLPMTSGLPLGVVAIRVTTANGSLVPNLFERQNESQRFVQAVCFNKAGPEPKPLLVKPRQEETAE